MRLLITGGCGFVGTNVAHAARLRGDEVHVFDNLSRWGSGENLAWLQAHGGVRFHYGDIRNRNDVEGVVRAVKPDGVIHLAGQVAMTAALRDPRRDFETNVVGTFHLLEAVREYARGAGFLYSSTNKVYGDLSWVAYEETATRYVARDFPEGFGEETPLALSTPYGCSKGAADQYVVDYAKMYGLRTVVFRHSTIFGERQFATFDQGWVGWFVQQALEVRRNPEREPFTIAGNGKQVRDVLFADDLVRCYFAALERINDISGEVFNIGGGVSNSMSLLELFAHLEEVLGVKLRYRSEAWRPSDQKVFIACIRKAEELLSWRPVVDKITGINAMIRWMEARERGEA
ncbi:MAG: GDP-mannose 4,6-dehydratase [bacterium]|nr:GDP-mannose 4,6-dehydratase [bacterium]